MLLKWRSKVLKHSVCMRLYVKIPQLIWLVWRTIVPNHWSPCILSFVRENHLAMYIFHKARRSLSTLAAHCQSSNSRRKPDQVLFHLSQRVFPDENRWGCFSQDRNDSLGERRESFESSPLFVTPFLSFSLSPSVGSFCAVRYGISRSCMHTCIERANSPECTRNRSSVWVCVKNSLREGKRGLAIHRHTQVEAIEKSVWLKGSSLSDRTWKDPRIVIIENKSFSNTSASNA